MTDEQKLNRFYIRVSDEYCSLTVSWLRIVRAEHENLTTSRNRHHFYELQNMLDGGISFRVSDKDLHLGKGEFVLTPIDCYHEITEYEENTCKLVFGFDAEINDEKLKSKLSDMEIKVYEESGTMRGLAQLFDSLTFASSSTVGIQIRSMTEAFFFAMLDAMFPDTNTYSYGRKSDYKKDLVEQIVQYVRSHAGNRFVTVEDLTNVFHLSRRHMSRICMETAGKTPREILDEERLRYIRELLTTTSYTLHEIAFLTGFNSEQSLVRFFKAKENYTPARYRKDTLIT